MKKLAVLSVVLGFILSSCQGAAVGPTATATIPPSTDTPSPQPTFTLTKVPPTNTPTVTKTPTPTLTLTPVPTPVVEASQIIGIWRKEAGGNLYSYLWFKDDGTWTTAVYPIGQMVPLKAFDDAKQFGLYWVLEDGIKIQSDHNAQFCPGEAAIYEAQLLGAGVLSLIVFFAQFLREP